MISTIAVCEMINPFICCESMINKQYYYKGVLINS